MTPRSVFGALLTVALGVSLAIGCAYYEDRAADRITEIGRLMAPVDERVIHGDDAFTPNERAAFERGLVAWQQFTRGRVHLTVAWDLDDANYLTLRPALFRVEPNVLQGRDAAWTVGESMWSAPESCPDKQACFMHEVGHFLGLCTAARGHVPYPHNVMSASNPSHDFGYGDWRECLAVGVCRESVPDVTTVTVKVDPAVPNVEPDYPRTP